MKCDRCLFLIITMIITVPAVYFTGVDTRLKFSIEPSLGKNGFQQVSFYLFIMAALGQTLKYYIPVKDPPPLLT